MGGGIYQAHLRHCNPDCRRRPLGDQPQQNFHCHREEGMQRPVAEGEPNRHSDRVDQGSQHGKRSRLGHLAGLSALRSTTSCSELKRSWAPMPSLQEQTSARECKRAAPTPMLFLLLLKVTAQRSCFVEYQHVSLNIVSVAM